MPQLTEKQEPRLKQALEQFFTSQNAALDFFIGLLNSDASDNNKQMVQLYLAQAEITNNTPYDTQVAQLVQKGLTSDFKTQRDEITSKLVALDALMQGKPTPPTDNDKLIKEYIEHAKKVQEAIAKATGTTTTVNSKTNSDGSNSNTDFLDVTATFSVWNALKNNIDKYIALNQDTRLTSTDVSDAYTDVTTNFSDYSIAIVDLLQSEFPHKNNTNLTALQKVFQDILDKIETIPDDKNSTQTDIMKKACQSIVQVIATTLQNPSSVLDDFKTLYNSIADRIRQHSKLFDKNGSENEHIEAIYRLSSDTILTEEISNFILLFNRLPLNEQKQYSKHFVGVVRFYRNALYRIFQFIQTPTDTKTMNADLIKGLEIISNSIQKGPQLNDIPNIVQRQKEIPFAYRILESLIEVAEKLSVLIASEYNSLQENKELTRLNEFFIQVLHRLKIGSNNDIFEFFRHLLGTPNLWSNARSLIEQIADQIDNIKESKLKESAEHFEAVLRTILDLIDALPMEIFDLQNDKTKVFDEVSNWKRFLQQLMNVVGEKLEQHQEILGSTKMLLVNLFDAIENLHTAIFQFDENEPKVDDDDTTPSKPEDDDTTTIPEPEDVDTPPPDIDQTDDTQGEDNPDNEDEPSDQQMQQLLDEIARLTDKAGQLDNYKNTDNSEK